MPDLAGKILLPCTIRTAMTFYLGNEASEAVMQNLAPMLTLADRISSQPPRKTKRGDETRKLGRDLTGILAVQCFER